MKNRKVSVSLDELAAMSRLGLTLSEMGDKFGVSRQRISQLLKAATASGISVTLRGSCRSQSKDRPNLTRTYAQPTTVICAQCNQSFVRPPDCKNVTCSKKCSGLLRGQKLTKAGDYSKNTYVSLVCEHCGKSFQRSNFVNTICKRNAAKRIFCGRDCYHAARRKSK